MWWVMLKALSVVDWTNDSGRRSGILETTEFVAFAVRLCASSARESKERLFQQDC